MLLSYLKLRQVKTIFSLIFFERFCSFCFLAGGMCTYPGVFALHYHNHFREKASFLYLIHMAEVVTRSSKFDRDL